MKDEKVIAMLANSCMGCHILEKKTAATRIRNNILAVAMRLERSEYLLCNGFCMEICGTGDAFFFQIRKETRPIQGIHALDAR